MNLNGTTFSKEVEESFAGNLFGMVYPKRAAPPPPGIDQRTAALRVLRAYLAEVPLSIPDRGVDGNMTLRQWYIPKENIHISIPDHEQEVQFPCITMLSGGRGEYESLGLGVYFDEATYNVFGPGTALTRLSEYVETITLEIMANKRAELWSIFAGLEAALTPTEGQYGLYFKLKEYFYQPCRITLDSRGMNEDPTGAALNRRKANINVELCVPRVKLVNVRTMEPVVGVYVDDPSAISSDDLEI